jgi:hypothetical protein
LAKIPIEDRERLTREIRQLLRDGNGVDYICETLDINRRTFFRYKKKVINEIVRQYKPQKNEVQIQHSLLRDTLEDGIEINRQIATNPSFTPIARSNSTDKMIIYRAQLTKLTEEGYLERPQLLSKVIPINERDSSNNK